jgi:hypothetical protein
MKWINLADRKPPSLAEAIVRITKKPRREPVFPVHSYKYKDNGTIDMWKGTDGANFKLSDFEWLDETQRKPDRFVGARDVPEGSPGWYYNKGIVWKEREDGNFSREDGIGTIVCRDAFFEFVSRGWLKYIDSVTDIVMKIENLPQSNAS